MIKKIEEETTFIRKTVRTLLDIDSIKIVVYRHISYDEFTSDDNETNFFTLAKSGDETPIGETELEELLGEDRYEELNNFINDNL